DIGPFLSTELALAAGVYHREIRCSSGLRYYAQDAGGPLGRNLPSGEFQKVRTLEDLMSHLPECRDVRPVRLDFWAGSIGCPEGARLSLGFLSVLDNRRLVPPPVGCLNLPGQLLSFQHRSILLRLKGGDRLSANVDGRELELPLDLSHRQIEILRVGRLV